MSHTTVASGEFKNIMAEKVKNSWCKVRDCRYRNTHIAAGHRCGTCGQFGHGQVECGKQIALNNLADDTKDDALDKNMYCTSNGCVSKHNHTIEAHICHVCSERHPREECPISPVDELPYNSNNIMTQSTAGILKSLFDSVKEAWGAIPGKIYTIKYTEMGCSVYIKRSAPTEPLYGYFMHTDSWGQYDADGVGDQATLSLFLEGFIRV